MMGFGIWNGEGRAFYAAGFVCFVAVAIGCSPLYRDVDEVELKDAGGDLGDSRDGSVVDATDGGTDTNVPTDTTGMDAIEDADGTVDRDARDGAGDSSEPDLGDTSDAIADGSDTTPGDTGEEVGDGTSDVDTDGGADTTIIETPTAKKDVIITEFLADPLATVDTEGEWFELYNPSSTTSYDLENCIMKDHQTNSFTINGSNGSFVVGPKEYVVFGASSNLGFVGGSADYEYNRDDFALANSGDELVLSCNSTLIYEVDYEDGANWGTGNNEIIEGEADGLDPSKLTTANGNDASNWCKQTSDQGNGDKGTPGGPNDSC